MITYTWKISPLSVKDEGSLKDVVKSTPWSLIATEDGESAAISRIAYMDDAVSSSFTDFNSITQDNVKAWILSYENKTEAELQKEVRDLLVYKTTKVKVPTGWSS